MKIATHKDLRVWQEAVDAAMTIFVATKRFPAEEKYSLVDQVRRSSRAVAAAISEAWRRRRYEAAFINKLNEAEGEAAETQTWIEFAYRCGYLKGPEATALDACYEQILGRLVTMISRPDCWVLRRNPAPKPPVAR